MNPKLNPDPDPFQPCERKTPSSILLRLALGLLSGVCVIQQLPVIPPIWLWSALFVPSFILAHRAHYFKSALVFGLCWAGIHGALSLNDTLPVADEREEALVEGTVLDMPRRMERGLRFDFHITHVLKPVSTSLPEKVRISWYDDTSTVKAGQTWRLRLSLRQPRGMMNPGSIDYEQWQFSQGIRAVGYVRNSADNRLLQGHATPDTWLMIWRQSTCDQLDRALAGSPVAGLLKAITMGAEDDITRPQWDVLRKTGTAHLIAISGSHIALIAGFVFFTTRYLCAALGLVRWSPPRIAACASLLAALSYSALADFSIPTQRAMIMITIAMTAILLQRHHRILNLLSLAIIAIILWDPLAVISVGFWLSFGAVGLIAYTVTGRIRQTSATRQALHINWVTALGLAPLLLLFFRQVSLISPIANALAVPVLGTLLVPLCLAGTLLLSLAPTLGQWLLGLAGWILQHFWILLEWFAQLPLAQFTQAQLPLWTLMFALWGVLLLLAPRGIPSRSLGIIMLLPAILHRPWHPEAGNYRLTLLDVGQGLSAVIETRHNTLVFDTGARMGPGFDMGEAVISPYLRYRGIATIDMLVISHGDNDHIGGAESLLNEFPVTAVYSSVPAIPGAAAVIPCHTGQEWEWDQVRFEMLGPVATSQKENDNSCVLKVTGEGGSVLLTGDIEAPGERLLLEADPEKIRSRILIVPHHGSKTSSTDDFLTHVQPEWAFFPVGYMNRYGFPHAPVMARYQSHHIGIMNTALNGAIILDVEPDNKGLIPEGYRQINRHYWSLP